MPKARKQSTLRLRRIHLKISYLNVAGMDESAFDRMAAIYNPMPVGAMGQLPVPARQSLGYGLTFTFVYADEFKDPSPNTAIVNAHRRMH